MHVINYIYEGLSVGNKLITEYQSINNNLLKMLNGIVCDMTKTECQSLNAFSFKHKNGLFKWDGPSSSHLVYVESTNEFYEVCCQIPNWMTGAIIQWIKLAMPNTVYGQKELKIFVFVGENIMIR